MDCEICLSESGRKQGEYVLRTFGITAGEAEEKLKGISFRKEVHPGGLDLLFEGEEDRSRARIRLGDAVYADSWLSMEEVVGELLRKRGLTLSIAESCTGGLISARIVNVPGSSFWASARRH